MRLTSFWQLVLGFALLFPCLQTNAQVSDTDTNQPKNEIQYGIRPFTILHTKDKQALEVVPTAQFLTLDERVLEQILQTRPATLDLELPYKGSWLRLQLARTEIATDDFSVLNERESEQAYTPGVHYHGQFDMEGNSENVAFSFFDTEIMGLIIRPIGGNLVLGKLANTGNRLHYVLYDDREMTVKNPFNCHADQKDDGHADEPESSVAAVTGCVRVFLEADNELFVEKGGSVQSTVNYLLGAWNQAAVLYTNEQINISISQILVWTTPDFYNTTSSATVLNQFRTFRTSFNGDLAHLVGTGGNNLGGIAYVDVLCQSSYNRAYSDITATYNNVPTFSWTIEVMTHEMGHNLGSNHTQWCGWTGGAIDNCVSPEGACSPGPAPTNGGTIMSYCHLSSVGINFNNGFGPQPGNKVRAEVGGATCLFPTCPTPPSCTAPVNLSVSGNTGTTAIISWENTSGASSYTLRHRAVGASQWTTLNNATSPTTLNGLPGNDEVEVVVQAVCGGTASDYTNGILFVTGAGGGGGGGGTTCDAPGNLAVTPGTVSAAVSWSAVSGASGYQVSWKLSTASTWGADVSANSNTYNITGLTAGTTYNVRVRSVCSGTNSAYATNVFTTTGGGTSCGAPANLASTPAATTCSVSWGAVSGANSYQVSWKKNNVSTWGANVSSNTTSYSISGLTAATAYNVRVRAVCGNGTSAYTTGNFTTTTSGTSCGAPTNVTANPAATTATANWTVVSGATSYQVSWKKNTSSTWGTTVTATAPSVNIAGLSASTVYNLRVRSVCGGTNSAYTTINFTTTAAATCNAPTSLTTMTTTGSATISWGAVNGALSYKLQWKSATSGAWSTPISVGNSTSYTITGLSAGSNYNVRVQTVCVSGTSTYMTANFTTQSNGGSSCKIPAGLVVDEITNSTARISWVPVAGAVSYTLQVKRSLFGNWLTFSNLPVNQVTLQGLLTWTSYEVRVSTNCSDGTNSGYSPIVVFTTAYLLPPVAEERAPDPNVFSIDVSERLEDTPATLSISPNPSTGRVMILTELPDDTKLMIQVSDAYGRIVRRESYLLDGNGIAMDLSELGSGIYFVSGYTSGQQLPVERLVIE